MGRAQQQAMKVDLGIDLGLLIHQDKSKTHSVLDAVTAQNRAVC